MTFFIALLIFIGSMHPYLTIPALMLSIIFSIMIANYSIKHLSWKNCRNIMFIIMFQNLLIGCGAHLTSNYSSQLKYMTQIPFILVAINWFWPYVCRISKNRRLQLDRSEKYFFGLLACIALSLLIGRGNIQSILLNFRNMTCFFMFFEISKRNIRSKEEFNKFLYSVFNLALLFLVCGIILLIGGYSLYEKIGINEVYVAKGQEYLGRLDGRFTTILFKKRVTRMGSILYEPVNLAYFYSYALITSIFTDWSKDKVIKAFYSIICFIGLVLTYGKGGYMIAAAAFLFLIGENIINKIKVYMYGRKRKNKFVLLLVGGIAVAFAVWYYVKIGAAAKQHFWGVIATFRSVLRKPIGYGLGKGGNAARTFSNGAIGRDDWFASGGETAVMSFIYQIGIQGFLFLFMTLCSTISNKNKKTNNLILNLSYYIPFIVIGIGLLQDNTFTVQCIYLPMIIQGALYNLGS